MTVGERYLSLDQEIRRIAKDCGRDLSEVSLVSVTKKHSLKHVLPAYEAGSRIFGENRVQEALEKISEAPDDIDWHLIGTLQKNKVRKVVGHFALIHSVDTPELAEKISEVSVEKGIKTAILLQVNTSGEVAKHGMTAEQWMNSFKSLLMLEGIEIQGLMTMAPFVEDQKVIRNCFADLRHLRDQLQKMAGDQCALKHLSMGMSHDYAIAIEEGATLVRIGTAIFGERN